MERTGTAARGTITGFYTVLVDGDDLQEPIADAARSILDGHIVLSRKLAAENHYPAVDVLNSVSRLMTELITPEHQEAAHALREALATYADARDLVNIGAYVSGSNPAIDRALVLMPRIRDFLCQPYDASASFDATLGALRAIFASSA
jgi:flagellar biosynthesis/type III secretory pathway ATPase